MDIFTLKCFWALAEHHNFTRAAFHLHVSQPTLSRIIAGLESELDVKLFHRRKYEITLSDAGREFLGYAKKIIQECEEAVRHTQAVWQGTRGSIQIGFLPAMCMQILPQLVRRMNVEYPQFELILEPYTQDELIRELKEETIDMALMMYWNVERLASFEREIFFWDDYYVVLHKEHKLANREKIYLREICSEKVLFYKRVGDTKARDHVEVGIVANQIETELKFFFEDGKTVSSLLGLMTLIECKKGIGILPSHLNINGFPALRFVKLSFDDDTMNFAFRGCICYKKEKENPIINTVVNILREEAKEFKMKKEDTGR